MSVPVNWWESFFTGLAVEGWSIMPFEALTRSEVDFLVKHLRLGEGSRVLDVPCGAGRHSFELAARGYDVVGVDQSEEFLAIARAAPRRPGLTPAFERRDMRDLPWPAEFDGAFCLCNSFGYLDDAGNKAFLHSAARALKPGGRIVLEASAVAETLLPNFTPQSWYEMGGILMLRSGRYDHLSGRAETDYTFIQGGRKEKKSASYRVYNYREVVSLLEGAGFGEIEAFGDLSGAPFNFGSKGLYFVAARR